MLKFQVNKKLAPIPIKNYGFFRRDIKDIIEDSDLNDKTKKARNDEKKRVEVLSNRLRNAGIDVDSDSEEYCDLVQHKNDNYNVKDSEGRVVVNIGHDKDEADIYLPPKITKQVMPHQIGGIRFLFDNIIESVKTFESSKGFGCILSHSMGLGKTLQLIALVDIFLQQKTAKTVMIVMPINVLNNWISEFHKWLPERRQLFTIDKLSVKVRDDKIFVWHNSGGILLIGYEKYYRIISNCEAKIQRPMDCSKEELRDAKRLKEALVDPGPQMIICDEGHRIKNDETGISKTLKKIKTKRRVILTGYPLQNKMKEYYCMVDFVRPKYLGDKWEFKNQFDIPITNGQSKNSDEAEKEEMRGRLHVLSHLTLGFIQRRKEDVLGKYIPEKQEFVVFCKLSPKQRKLLHEFLNVTLANGLNDREGKISLFRTFVVCSKICNHPDIVNDVIKRGVEAEEIDTEAQTQLFHYVWAKSHFGPNYETEVLENSSKMVILFDIIEETVAKGEKLLIFSQWLFTLDLIERLLKSKNVFPSHSKNSKLRKYYRIDGQTKTDERDLLVRKFNSENSDVNIFLISTKAGGVGINLIGANRIVIFDACWNPCHDAQASCRIYRFGQTKPCFIYRLISDNSLEKRIFNKQIFKQGMFKGVVDQQRIDFKFNQNEIRALLFELRKELQQIDDNNSLDRHALSQLKDPVLSAVYHNNSSFLTGPPNELNTFLEELGKGLGLTSKQKKEAMMAFEEGELRNQKFKSKVESLADSFRDIVL